MWNYTQFCKITVEELIEKFTVLRMPKLGPEVALQTDVVVEQTKVDTQTDEIFNYAHDSQA